MALSIDISSKDIKPLSNPLGLSRNDRQQRPDANQAPNKPKKKRNWKKFFGLTVLVLLLIGGFYAFRFYQLAGSIGIKIKPTDILNPIKKDPQLKRDSTNTYTAVLLVGIDTRTTQSKLQNTDTILIATYNHQTNDIVMVSIPRDFHAEVPGQPGYYNKINGIYAKGERIAAGTGLEYLKKEAEKVTDLEIQYYAMIDLQGFKEVIDTVGGVTINVENSFTDREYPTDDDRIETITFKKGVQTMNGATALKYARSRKGDNGEGSDYQRARRQQKVIVAVKDKVLSTETLLNPAKVLDIISSVEKNLKLSEFTTEDIQAAINLGSKQKESGGNSYSFVLDPSIGIGYSTIISVGPFPTLDYYIAPVKGEGVYTDIHQILSKIMVSPQLYSEDPIIRLYDTGAGYQTVYNKTLELQKKYPHLSILFMGTLFTDKEGTIVYSNVKDNFSSSVIELAKTLETEETQKPSYITTRLNNESVVILMGKPPAPPTSDETEAQ